MCLKSSKHGRRLAGINRQLYMDFKFKKDTYKQWKQGQSTPEEHGSITSVYRDNVERANAQLELKQLRNVQDKRKAFHISKKKNKTTNH